MADSGIKWNLEGALHFIRDLQPWAEERGYYLALAGGVLNKGFSVNELDLVAVPKTLQSDHYFFVNELIVKLGWMAYWCSKVPGGTHCKFPNDIEISVMKHG